MLEFYIARHGQNQDNVEGILNGHRDRPLTELGLQQAESLALGIQEKGLSLDKIYTSPLQRAAITAETVAKVLGLEKPEIEADLIERDFGIMTGQQQDRIVELCSPDIIKTSTVTYFLSAEGAETWPQSVERAHRLLDKLNTRHRDGSLLLVTHGDIGKMIYAAYYDLPWQNVLPSFHFGNSELIHLSPLIKPSQAHIYQVEQHNH